MTGDPAIPAGERVAEVLEGPWRHGSEQRWRVRLRGGEIGILGQLLPELARDDAVRRRYVADVSRLAGAPDSVAPVLAHGPEPGPGAADQSPPWRLRADPAGQTLRDWLRDGAPAPIDRVAEIGVALGRALIPLHAAGMVVRDLDPAHVVLTGPRTAVLTDVGLSRVDILSSRTATSLLLEGSPYASPEQLRRTSVDPRADLFGLGVILFQAATGELPYGSGPALLDPNTEVPRLTGLRHDVPADFEAVVRACLHPIPDERPDSAADVTRMLQGEGGSLVPVDRTTCQHCGAALRIGQRICIGCGREAVKFKHAWNGRGASVDLVKVSEDADQLAWLRRFLGSISEGEIPPLNFIVGNERMYSQAEQARRIALPYRLFFGVEPESAREIARQMEAHGFGVRIREASSTKAHKLWTPNGREVLLGALAVGAVTLAFGAGLVAGIGIAMMALGLTVAAGIGVAASAAGWGGRRGGTIKGVSQLRLRRAPAALPASDPLVARIAALLSERTADDVREQLGEVALWVQRFVDHRAQQSGAAATEVEMVTGPVNPLVELLETETRRIDGLDLAMSDLDEGDLVRGLAAAQARGATPTEREGLLEGLDRIRRLEDQRAAAFGRLLEISSLLRRATTLGLRIEDGDGD